MSVTIILTNCGSEEEARKIALDLVQSRRAACANIVPIRSVYRWKEKLEESDEHMLIIKTQSVLASEAAKRIRELHSYELPEIIELKPDGGSDAYLRWIIAETSSPVKTFET